MRRDYADRAWLLGEQSGHRCEVPPRSSVPTVRHHPDVLRRQAQAHRDAVEPAWAPLGALGVCVVMVWLLSLAADCGGL